MHQDEQETTKKAPYLQVVQHDGLACQTARSHHHICPEQPNPVLQDKHYLADRWVAQLRLMTVHLQSKMQTVARGKNCVLLLERLKVILGHL